MPTQEDYKTARALAIEALAKADLAVCCKNAGVSFENISVGKKRISIPFLGKVHELVAENDKIFFDETVGAVKLQDQVLLLHYLMTATGAAMENRWITFREVPSGSFYYAAFVKRAIAPLQKSFGEKPSLLAEVARVMGQVSPLPGDVALKIFALPRVPVIFRALSPGDGDTWPIA